MVTREQMRGMTDPEAVIALIGDGNAWTSDPRMPWVSDWAEMRRQVRRVLRRRGLRLEALTRCIDGGTYWVITKEEGP